MGPLIKQIGLTRLAAILGVTGGVAAVLATVMLRLGEPPMGLLFSSLDFDDAQEITQRLDQANIPYELRGGGSAILAPQDEIMNLRLTLASEGLPSGGVVGYEIFDETDSFGVTSFQQNVNRLRALEGELARTIGSIQSVRSARVHLVVPERELFSRDKNAPTASIVIDASRSGLNAQTTRAIQNLVASAVPDLTPQRVTILDSQGNLLARASSGDDDDNMMANETFLERTAASEARIRGTVEDIVASIVGPDNVRVQVAAEMDFSRVTERREIFDPDGQVVLSSHTTEETESDNESERDETVTIANALPEADEAVDDGPSAQSSSSRSRTEEQINYEISKTYRNEVQEIGSIERLSVAVAVNGVWDAGADGAETYTPRTEDEMEQIRALVRSAVGFDASRGDQLEVVNVQFVKPEIPEAAPAPTPFLGLTKDDYMRIAEISVLGLIGLILVFFVLRPFLSGKSKEQTEGAAAMLTTADGAPAQLTGPSGEPIAVDASGQISQLPPPEDASNLEQQIDIAQVQGQVKASSVKKVAEIVQKHPEESIGILRAWLHEA